MYMLYVVRKVNIYRLPCQLTTVTFPTAIHGALHVPLASFFNHLGPFVHPVVLSEARATSVSTVLATSAKPPAIRMFSI
jgi:hypothetical protein